jgi:hypothetical protein
MGLASLCISNRAHFIPLAFRSVYGSSGPTIRSSSTFANPTWRHTSLYRRIRPSPIVPPHAPLINARAVSWATKFNLRPSGPPNDSDAHEEAAKAAVLEAIKGRQQTDLMLRCESASVVTLQFRKLAQFHLHIGTVLDAEGTLSDLTIMVLLLIIIITHHLDV